MSGISAHIARFGAHGLAIFGVWRLVFLGKAVGGRVGGVEIEMRDHELKVTRRARCKPFEPEFQSVLGQPAIQKPKAPPGAAAICRKAETPA